MTQPGLAAAMRELGARTEQRDISRCEGDVYEPKLRAFAALAHVFGISMEEHAACGAAGPSEQPDVGTAAPSLDGRGARGGGRKRGGSTPLEADDQDAMRLAVQGNQADLEEPAQADAEV